MKGPHPSLPPPASRPWVTCAILATTAASLGGQPRVGLYLCAGIVLAAAVLHRTLVALIVAAVSLIAWMASATLPPLPPGRIEARGVMASDVIEGRYGPYALIGLPGGPVLADLPEEARASRGDQVLVSGVRSGDPGWWGIRRHRGTLTVSALQVTSPPSSPILRAGNLVRERVGDRLRPLEGGRALLAGFLVGDTSGLEPVDDAAMERAGLSHFTAVSGSNVALFLGLVYFLAGPAGVGPKKRAVIGLAALPVFAAATRFEPSVLRASCMAGIALVGRLIGVSLEAWQLLSAAVIGLILLDPMLVRSAGFQLSVLATAGVIVGSRWPTRGGPAHRALAITLGAQVAVAPVLVLHFGTVPLLSALANLLAAPLVAAATLIGALGVVGPGVLVSVAAWLAGLVLALARFASGLPQIGWLGLVLVTVGGACFWKMPRARGGLALVAAVAAGLLVLGPIRPLPDPGAVVLDVGQGDAILLHGGQGRFALVDGGPDPVTLFESLRGYGVHAVELVVVSHVHADHVTGLQAVLGRVPVGSIWAAPEPHESPAWTELAREAGVAGFDMVWPEPGTTYRLGELTLEVEGPVRRYASPNDQSIVISVRGPRRTMLLAGDIETVAQGELGHLRADVLKVPHQGAGTSDAGWLVSVGADTAIISVGPNEFGHPAPWVIETLETSGAAVLRTDRMGDISVPLG